MNIYTKNGDRGTTDLVRTKNVSKSDDRIQLVGDYRRTYQPSGTCKDHDEGSGHDPLP